MIEPRPEQPEDEGEEMTVKRICAYCGKELGEATMEVPAGFPPVTHGICEGCEKKVVEQFKRGEPKPPRAS